MQYKGVSSYSHRIQVAHFVLPNWGNDAIREFLDCGDIACNWTSSSNMDVLREHLSYQEYPFPSLNTLSLSLYNIHTSSRPAHCKLTSNVTMAESLEAESRYGHVFSRYSKNFDGFSGINPHSIVQNIYPSSVLRKSALIPLRNFSSLIKAAAFVSSDCNSGRHSRRDELVKRVREAGFRVDGLGKCMHSVGPDSVHLARIKPGARRGQPKRNAINHYMFNFAFENSVESGYVSEKPFDALSAGITI